MTTPPLEVLYEDNHLLAVNKPAGLPTMGVPEGVPTLLALAKQYVKLRFQKPGNVYLGVMSRLDAPVTGVVLLARTSKAAARLTEQFRTHTVEKIYWALVCGAPQPPEGEYLDWLVHDERHRRVRIATPTEPGAREARLSYRQLSRQADVTLLEIRLQTGRKHQIRLQLSSRGNPILGDRKYGSQRPFGSGIALHSRRLTIIHPIRGEPLVFEAPPPRCWAEWLGGRGRNLGI
jgi:23S rRNA pseudouridine1911/1915/1917 synthase